MAKKPADKPIGAAKTSQTWALASCLTASLFIPSEADAQASRKQGSGMDISQASTSVRSIHVVMRAADGTLVFKLGDNDTAKAFAALLPLELTLEDYDETEKITYLPSKLTPHGNGEGYTPAQGDLAYYSPWGNLAIFHKDFAYSPELIKLGALVSGMDIVRKKGAIKVRIELALQV